MPQHCRFCGKTEKQHGGRPCVDVAGFKALLKRANEAEAKQKAEAKKDPE